MLWQKNFKEQEKLELIIRKYHLDRRTLNLEASYEVYKDDLMYDNHLILYMQDSFQNIQIEIAKFKIADFLIEYNGRNEIEEDFTWEFIDFINEYIIGDP